MQPAADPPEDRATRIPSRFFHEGEVVDQEVLRAVYSELRELAGRQLARQRPGHTLQPTALVNEAWIRLSGRPDAGFESRGRFFALASQAMRSALVDHARARGAAKRGGGNERVTLSGLAGPAAADSGIDVLALEEALERLEEQNPELVRIVELRFFSGLDHAEVAEALGLSLRTAKRRWRLARAWLHGELTR